MAAGALPALVPYAAMAGLGWVYYQRIRRQFGRQPWQPKRAVARVVLLMLVLGMLALAAVFSPGAGWAVGGGVIVGLGLGTFGVMHTRVELHEGARSYVPNPWIGGALSLLLVCRLAWRFLHGGFVQQQGASPLTLAFAATLIGYYLAYSLLLMRRMRALAPAA